MNNFSQNNHYRGCLIPFIKGDRIGRVFGQSLLTALFVSLIFIGRGALADVDVGGPGPARIISGSKSPDGAYPWMVALVQNYNGRAVDEHFCGGTLIAPQWVLTAAHCVTDFSGSAVDPDFYDILLGQNRLSSNTGQRMNVRGAVIHPNYDPRTLRFDYALLKLDSPVLYTPIEVATPFLSELYTAGTPAKVLGWGFMDPKLPILPDDLREASVPVVSSQTCLEANGRFLDSATMVCAGELSSSDLRPDSCFGDSGGPLVVSVDGRPVQIGVVSWGFECASSKTYGVYSHVAAGNEFIASRPIIAPRVPSFFGQTVLTGDLRVGGYAEVSAVPWRGDPLTSVAYEWYDDGGNLLASTTTNIVALSDEFGDKFLTVVTSATNEGGTAQVGSESVLVRGAEPTPQPTSTVTPMPSDQTAPSVTRAGERYRPYRATVFVEVVDGGPVSSGIAAVTADLKIQFPPNTRTGSKSPKGRVQRKRISGMSAGSSLYRFDIDRVRGARYRLLVSATDGVGLSSNVIGVDLRRQR